MASYEEPIGIVTHYWPKAHAASVRIDHGDLHLGDAIHIKGRRSELEERVNSMELDHRPIQAAHEGQVIGIHVDQKVHVGDRVMLVHDPFDPSQAEGLRDLFGDA